MIRRQRSSTCGEIVSGVWTVCHALPLALLHTSETCGSTPREHLRPVELCLRHSKEAAARSSADIPLKTGQIEPRRCELNKPTSIAVASGHPILHLVETALGPDGAGKARSAAGPFFKCVKTKPLLASHSAYGGLLLGARNCLHGRCKLWLTSRKRSP
jgi:hypothetical protein